MKLSRPKAGTVMVFGVFDGLHAGHRAFLRQAARCAKHLIAVVARDSMVWELKKKKPQWNERKRLAAVQKFTAVSLAVLGDKEQGTYKVVKKYKPDVICLGYDQHFLGRDLRKRIRIGVLPPLNLVQARVFRS